MLYTLIPSLYCPLLEGISVLIVAEPFPSALGFYCLFQWTMSFESLYEPKQYNSRSKKEKHLLINIIDVLICTQTFEYD